MRTLRALLWASLIAGLSGCPQEVALSDTPDAGGADAGKGPPPDSGRIEEDAGCPLFPVPGLEVVVDGPDGRICDAEVEAREGAFTTLLQAGGEPAACYYFGVFERAGVYTVTARRAGFVPASATGIAVSLDACGDALTQPVSLSLSSGEPPQDGGVPGGVPDGGAPAGDGGTPVDGGADAGALPAAPCPDGLVAHEGDFSLASADDAAALNGIECIAGTLTLTGGAPATVDLPDLQVITGALAITGATSLVDAVLDQLDSLGAGISAADNALLEQIRLDGLTSLGGDVSLTGNAALVRLDIRSLPALPGALIARDNPAFDRVDGGGLLGIAGDLSLTGGVAADLRLQNVVTVDGALELVGNSGIQDMDAFNDLTTVGGALRVRENPNLDAGQLAQWLQGVNVTGQTETCGNNGDAACP